MQHFSLLFSLLSFLSWAPTVCAQQPLDEFLASYPFGEHRCLTVTPDGTRGFVAEGAGIALLDLTNLPAVPPVTELAAIQRTEVPHAAAEALAYYRHPDPDPNTGNRRRWLFIAGGSMGLSRINLCENLFAQPPIACGEGSFRWRLIDRPGSGATFQWKRCVDVAVVEHPQAGPLLLGLFAASSDPNKSSIGASEIAAFRLLPDGTTPLYARKEFTNLTPPPSFEYLATGMAPDPGDPNVVFVSLSKAWLWKVTVQHGPTPTLSVAQVPTPGIAACGMNSPTYPCTYGEAMTDVDAVVAGSAGTVAYATLDYGRVLEYRIATGVVKEKRLWEGTDPLYTLVMFPRRIDATVEGTHEVLVAVACQSTSWIEAEGAAPYTSTGLWSNLCLAPYIPDPNPFPGGTVGLSESVRLLWADPQTAFAPIYVGLGSSIPYGRTWGQIVVRRLGAFSYRLHAASSVSATTVFDIFPGAPPSALNAFGAPQAPFLDWELIATYAGNAILPSDGVVSEVNPNLLLFGGEPIGKIRFDAAQAQVIGPPIDIVPVPQTGSACPSHNGGFAGGTCFPLGPKHDTPNPFIASVFGSATWGDPFDPTKEWFLPGGANRILVNGMCGNELDLCSYGDPCSTLPAQPWFWRKEGLFPIGTNVGWYPTTFHPLVTPLNGAMMNMHWWQFRSPTALANFRTEDIPYTYSTTDPRLASPDPEFPEELPFPRLIHATRGGSDYGYKIFSPRNLMQLAAGSCSGSPLGLGERLLPAAQQEVRFVEALTHVELELPSGTGQCVISVGCALDSPGRPRYQGNNKVHVFSALKPQGSEGAGQISWIAAVAAGFVTSGPTIPNETNQPANCLWLPHHTKALVTLYSLDLVDLDAPTSPPPQLIRVLLGPPDSSAFAVRTATYGEGSSARVYAFVADLKGRLFTYDVSGDQIYLPTPPATGTPYLPVHSVLSPIATGTVSFPTDPRDGLAPNCVDVEIDGYYAYCALTRSGIGIVDISNPLAPFLHEVLDTPGLVQGLTFRRPTENEVQLVVGDSRAGFRLYGRSGGSGLSVDSTDQGDGSSSDEDSP